VAEAWVERPDGEALAVLALLVEGLDVGRWMMSIVAGSSVCER